MGCGIHVTRRNLSEKQGIRNLMLMPEMKLFEQSEFSSQALLLIRFRSPVFLRFRSGVRIPYPVSPVYSIREELLSISAFPKQTFLSQFLTKQKQRGVLIVKTATVPDCTDVFNKVPAWFPF